ncbi:hypothetical protein QJQ45_027091 [Haematococcus lacustris]|nr:hypothetical protein QJQ45_027091 [Haematococcus lacustris]
MEADIMNKVQPAPSPFTGSRLQQLEVGWGYWDFMPHLAPLAPHLTQLEVASAESNESGFVGSLSSLAAAVGSLTCLQSLEFDLDGVEAGDWFLTLLVPVLASLPSLHTLLLLQDTVHGDQVDVLLAATQITHLQVYSIGCLVFSRVSAACSWRQLEVHKMDWDSAAHLPLHSLTHPLQLALLGGIDLVGAEVLAAADLNLCERNKAGLELVNMRRSTQLLDLPEELLGAVLRQLRDGNSRLQVFMTSKRLATALLQHTPSIQLTHPLAVDLVCAPGDERCIHPFLAQALLTRKAHLELTLQPEGKLPAQQRPKRGGLLAVTLGAVELCPAVTHLIISFPKGLPRPVYIWKPVYSAGLAASYPSLTSLTLRSFQLSSTQLGRLLSHPALLPRLKHLDVCGTDIMNKSQPAPSPFTGSRLQHLRLGWGYWDFMPHLAPLAPHLTQLEVASAEINDSGFVGSLSSLAVAVGTLTCLQSLKFDLDGVEAGDWFLTLLVPVLASLPNLHTLLLLQDTVHGDQLDVLLAATQITHLQVYSIGCLVFSRVSAACSWRQLEVEEMDWLSAAHLPLHSLTHPLQLAQLGGVGPVGAEVLAAAELNLCERHKAGLEVEDMWLCRGSFDLLTAQHVSRNCPAAHQAPHPTVASSSSGQEGSQGSAAGGQAPMQRLGRCVKKVVLWSSHGWNEVITGFIGSGKRATAVHSTTTPACFLCACLKTLLNNILTQNHGRRIAVIENEASARLCLRPSIASHCRTGVRWWPCMIAVWCLLHGDNNIDSELVVKQEVVEGSRDTVMQLSNGCLCCTVRDDLIQALNRLVGGAAAAGLDALAQAQRTSSLRRAVQVEAGSRVKLDGVVTVVDAKHVSRHLDTPKEAGVVNEAVEQIAFADRTLLNKTDLVDTASLGSLEARLQAINKMATITPSQRAQDENERECVAAARRVFQLSLNASSLALDLQRLELACAFLLTDRLWAVAMADLAQLAVGLHANTAQRRLLTTPSALYSPRPASLSPTAAGPTAMGGHQGPGWVEKLEPFWQLFVTYVVEATAGTEHNLAWWMAAVKAGNAYLPDLVNPLQRAQPMNAKMLVVAAAQYVQEPTPTPGCLVLVGAAAGEGRVGGAAGHGRPHAQEVPLQVVSSLMQALVAAGETRCLRLHQQLGAACNVTSQGNGETAAVQVSPKQTGAASRAAPGEGLAACQRAMMTMWQTISYDCLAHCPHTDIAAAAAPQPHQASDVAKACEAVLTKVNALLGSPSNTPAATQQQTRHGQTRAQAAAAAAAAAQEPRKGSEAWDTSRG